MSMLPTQSSSSLILLFFFFNDTPTTEIYTLSLQTLFRSRPVHGLSLQQLRRASLVNICGFILRVEAGYVLILGSQRLDRKSTRLNSSHRCISYAVFCLKKKTHLKSNVSPQLINHHEL